MALSTASKTALALLIFNNTTWANVGDATGIVGSTGAGNMVVHLSTGTLTVASISTTTEAAYTGYSAPNVARSGAGWTCTAGVVTNTATVDMGTCTAGGGTPVTYMSVSSVSTPVIEFHALATPFTPANGGPVQFAIGGIVITFT